MLRLLASIEKQESASYEVIVVDQESTDSTREIALRHGARVVSREKPAFYSPPAQSRNVGAASATGNLLIHLDADMELPDVDFLVRFAQMFDDRHEAAIIHEVDIASGWWNRVKAVERACYWDSGLEYARGVTRRLFQEIAGYDPDISSGEDALIHQAYASRTQIAAADDVWLRHHTGKMSLTRLLSKKMSYGRTVSTYLALARERTGSNPSTGLIHDALKAYKRQAPKMLRQTPLEFICVLPLRFAEMVAVRIGMTLASRAGRKDGRAGSVQ